MRYENIDQWYCKNIDIPKRTLYFGPWQDGDTGLGTAEGRGAWEVDDWSAQNIIKGLYVLEQSKVAPINMIWFSYGGDWDSGMAIYDFINHIKSPVDIKCYGRVRSMGTIVMQACRKRYLSPNCLFMIHYGTDAHECAHSKDFINYAEVAKSNNKTMEDIYLKRIRNKRKRYTREALADLMKYDKYLTPRETVELGLADGIIK